MSITKPILALAAMAAVVLLLPACTTSSVTTTGAISRTQCVAVPKVPSGFVSLRLNRAGACAVDPESVFFEFSPDCRPCQHECRSMEKFRPQQVDAGKAYCSGVSDFCARCIKVYDFKEEGFACLEYAATIPGSTEPKPVRFLQCIDARGHNCNERVDCNDKIEAYLIGDEVK